MTNNIDRAAEIIHDHHDNCLDAANALADAGLLAAHAPAAVAEGVRLRKAIAAVRDDYQRSAEVDSLGHFSTVPLIPVFNDLADALTRILEGDTDE